MLTIDGIIYSLQRNGGITVYFNELLKYLEASEVGYQLSLEEPSAFQQRNIKSYASVLSRPVRQLERYRSCRLSAASTVFHSSYYRRAERYVPTVMTVYDFIYERHIGGFKRMVHSIQKNAAIRSAQSLICISAATKNDLLNFVGEEPGQSIHIIHCGVSESFRPINLPVISKPYILFVGQRGGYKNFKLATMALEFLPDLELVCVGGGTLHADEFKGVSANTRKRIHHAGSVDDVELNQLYCGATCLLYPSRYEGFGIPVVEAMRAGCPVVSLRCDAVMEVGGDALTLVDAEDAKAVADGVNATRSSARADLIARGFVVSGRFSWTETHRQTLEVYRSLM